MGGVQRARSEKGLLQTITELAGLLAAVAAIIYGAGALALSLRLAFEHLPWSNIVSGLPREFVISTGAGQVVLPAVAVGALYGLFRGLAGSEVRPPVIPRLREGSSVRMLPRYLLTMVLLLLPLLFVEAVRGTSMAEGLDLWLATGIGVLLAFLAIAVQEGRAAVAGRFPSSRTWNSVRAAATLAGIYAAAAMPAMMLAAAATPLTSAKICMTGGGEATGKLVGESGDRVYLGEEASNPEKEENRRIVVIPMAKIDQLFVGPHPTGARCEAW